MPRSNLRYVPDMVDGWWVVFDMRTGGMDARFGSAPSRDAILRSIVGTLATVDGLAAEEIGARTDGLSIARARKMLDE